MSDPVSRAGSQPEPRPTVLVVDDSLTVRMDLAEAFEAAGFAVRLSGTAAAAREELAAGTFALIVLDILLPDADGVAFLGELREAPHTAAVPVMLLSSETEVKDRVRGLSTGAEEYIGKPYDQSYVVARARELVRRSAPEAPAGGPRTVLVIDDSVSFRVALAAALEEGGYRVVTAASGEAGQRAAADHRPHAIVVDSVLPGIDGATVIRQIRLDAALRLTPCLLLTGSEDHQAELRALDAGADAFLRKDADTGIILARLGAMLRSAHEPAATAATASLLGPTRILAVDDSPTYLQAVASQLRDDGYDVVLASSGEEALELLAIQPVSCILLDLVMPGMSGHETCRRIKSDPALRDIPLVILTAREEQQAMIDGINAGADDYIPKSTDFDVLRARLRAQMRRKHFEDENRHMREQLLRREIDAAEARAAREVAEVRAALLADVEQKNAELARVNGELNAMNRELEAFSYSVSHDLRAPLRHVGSFVSLLEQRSGAQLDDESRNCLTHISEAAQRMGALIDDLLAFSRVGRVEMCKTYIALEPLVQDVLRELEPEIQGREIQWVVGPLGHVYADAALLRLALINLVSNALKFTRTRAMARIEIGRAVHGPADAGSRLPGPEDRVSGGEIVCYVRDNGVGFDMQYVNKLFGVFQRLHRARDFEGTGVGLANVQRIIQRHGGQTWAEGVVNEGAVFYFSLPNGPEGDGERDETHLAG